MEMQVDVSEEMDPKFAGFIKKLRLGEGTALKLWNGGITSAPALASSDKDDVKSIVNDPVLINTILPALQKCAFQITMAASPEDCALQMLRQAAGQQHNQQDTLQSDTDTFDPTRINTPTNGNVSNNQPVYQATRIGGLQMNMSGPTRTAANGRTTDVQITGGVFTNTAINANQPVTFNNQGATFVSNYTEDQSAKKEVPSSMIKL
uniref:Uncharacterized protein n=1 Tax=Ciona savignyi TaxID=51511 RepID=H2Y9B1_CIOSA